MTRVKICCISSVEEALLAIAHGAAAVGLVSSMPSGPGVIPEALIFEIACRVPPGVSSVLLTSQTDVNEIISQQRRTAVNCIQLCDRLDGRAHRELRAYLPGVSLIQVIHVTGEESLAEAMGVGRDVHALLLDSGRPGAAVRELGGTGRVHDWALSRRIREAVAAPMVLAGGLTPANVVAAVEQVKPYGVDVCTGVRTDGKLDAHKLEAFMDRVRSAPPGVGPPPPL